MRKTFRFKIEHQIELRKLLQHDYPDCHVQRAINRIEKRAHRYYRKVVRNRKAPLLFERYLRLDNLACRCENFLGATRDLDRLERKCVNSHLIRRLPKMLEPLVPKAERAARDAMKDFWKKGTMADRELVKLIGECVTVWYEETNVVANDIFDAGPPFIITHPLFPILDALHIKMEFSALRNIISHTQRRARQRAKRLMKAARGPK